MWILQTIFSPGLPESLLIAHTVTYEGHIYMVLGVFTIIIDLFNKTF